MIFELIEKTNAAVNQYVWGMPMLVLIIGTGIYFSIKSGFFQIRNIKLWLSKTIGSLFVKNKITDKKSITQFQAFCTALAATVGVGNIAGVASAIALGGPGAVFWMWVSAFFGMMTSYAENVLGIYFRKKNDKGEWSGGAMYYLRDGLKGKLNLGRTGKFLSIFFSVSCILASFGMGNMSQINTVSVNLLNTFEIPQITSGLVLMIIVFIVVIGGVKRIASVTEKLVPFMAVFYIVCTVIIFITNIERAKDVFEAVFKFAFGLKPVGGAVSGIAVKNAVSWGLKRGVFSNEAGLGSATIIHAAAETEECAEQGMWGILEVFIDTVVICTLTAFTVLSSGFVNLENGKVLASVSSVSLVTEAFKSVFGIWGERLLVTSILFFAFATVIGWSYFGLKAWEFIFGEKTAVVYKILFVLFVLIGSVAELELVWNISDTFNGLMALPNLIGVLLLSDVVFNVTENYKNKNNGKNRNKKLRRKSYGKDSCDI